ncbi:MAG: tripeptide aminopeptidase [Salibacteraceae bacterium]|jgi:tripeptide aminopeptidase
MNIHHTAVDRFLKYVKIDTQSDVHSTTIPSTIKQKDLGKVLVEELIAMGISDAAMDEWGYVYATLPANTEKDNVPVICFCSHMDTSPDASGTNVKPIIHTNYQGADLVLPDDSSVVIKASEHSDLKAQYGNDIITASGLTLLGADNKAGVAEIMDAMHFFTENPEVKHACIRILFTPDEEIGRGADKVDIKKLGADFGYTIDGETLGSIEDETFSADGVAIEITGVSAHPGFAFGKMESAVKIAGDIIAKLPKDRLSPESTEGREGFIHPLECNSTAEGAKLTFIVRSFKEVELKMFEAELENIVKNVMHFYPQSTYKFTITEQYRNMKNVLDQHPEVTEYAMKAIARAGVPVKRGSIRGGTDGSKLSFMGLPCPNIFAGEHAFHSKKEWVSVQDMEKAVKTIINLSMIWEEQA